MQKFMIQVLAINLTSIFMFGFSQANVVNVNALKQQLTQNKATWEASQNWVTQLEKKEVIKMLGFPEATLYGKDVTFQLQDIDIGGSDSIDWRNEKGQNWDSPVLNQGSCGSCVAFAAVAAFETQNNISKGLPWLNPQFSTQALFACGGGSCEGGWRPGTASNFLVNRGVPDEACAPYTMGATGVDVACSTVCADSAQRSQKVAKVVMPRGGQAVKQALKNGPLMTTLDVYDDFIAYKSGIYKRSPTAKYLGGHAVVIVGFNDLEKYWIVRNSWGKDWGEAGYVRMSYADTSGVSVQNWGYEISDKGPVSTTSVRSNQFVSLPVNLEIASTAAGVLNQNLNIISAQGSKLVLACDQPNCSFAMEEGSLPDGRYELYSETQTSAGVRIVSERKYFYVANTEPKSTTLTFSPSGFDATKPLSGRVEFDVQALTSGVPFSSLTFKVLQNGQEVYRRVSEVVLKNMVVGWRTGTVLNGNYEIQLEAALTTQSKEFKTFSAILPVSILN